MSGHCKGIIDMSPLLPGSSPGLRAGEICSPLRNS